MVGVGEISVMDQGAEGRLGKGEPSEHQADLTALKRQRATEVFCAWISIHQS